MFKTVSVLALSAALLAPPAMAQQASVITLQSALDQALARSSQLTAARAGANAAKGTQRQAGAFPNPEIGVQAENVAGNGAYRGFDSAEITYGVSQLVEISGKRSARQASADQEHAIAHVDAESTKLDLIRDVKIAYAEAVAAKEGMVLAEKQRALAAETLGNVRKRVDAAAEPLFQKSKSEVALSTSDIALDKAKRDYTIARKKLAALWDGGDATFDVDTSRFFEVSPPPPLPGGSGFQGSPLGQRLEAEVARSQAQYELEQANAIPDPRFNVGFKDFRATNEQALVVGVAIPIPLFDQNSGNIARARSEVTRAASARRIAEIGQGVELVRSQQEFENAYKEAQTLKTRIIPAAERAYAESRRGYDVGKFPYLEVLDAQRTLVDARVQYGEALKNYHIKSAEVERLTARYAPAENEKDDSHD